MPTPTENTPWYSPWACSGASPNDSAYSPAVNSISPKVSAAVPTRISPIAAYIGTCAAAKTSPMASAMTGPLRRMASAPSRGVSTPLATLVWSRTTSAQLSAKTSDTVQRGASVYSAIHTGISTVMKTSNMTRVPASMLTARNGRSARA